MNTAAQVVMLLRRTVALVDQMLARIDRRPTDDPWTLFEVKAVVGRLRAWCISVEQGDK